MLEFLKRLFTPSPPPEAEEPIPESMEFEVYEFLTKTYIELQKKEAPDEVDIEMKRNVMSAFSRVKVIFYKLDTPALSRFLVENRRREAATPPIPVD